MEANESVNPLDVIPKSDFDKLTRLTEHLIGVQEQFKTLLANEQANKELEKKRYQVIENAFHNLSSVVSIQGMAIAEFEKEFNQKDREIDQVRDQNEILQNQLLRMKYNTVGWVVIAIVVVALGMRIYRNVIMRGKFGAFRLRFLKDWPFVGGMPDLKKVKPGYGANHFSNNIKRV
ncbi:MAG: hypothetical protein ACFFG0_06025 [Candidatus Thorarchaeota archaeon]